MTNLSSLSKSGLAIAAAIVSFVIVKTVALAIDLEGSIWFSLAEFGVIGFFLALAIWFQRQAGVRSGAAQPGRDPGGPLPQGRAGSEQDGCTHRGRLGRRNGRRTVTVGRDGCGTRRAEPPA